MGSAAWVLVAMLSGEPTAWSVSGVDGVRLEHLMRDSSTGASASNECQRLDHSQLVTLNLSMPGKPTLSIPVTVRFRPRMNTFVVEPAASISAASRLRKVSTILIEGRPYSLRAADELLRDESCAGF